MKLEGQSGLPGNELPHGELAEITELTELAHRFRHAGPFLLAS